MASQIERRKFLARLGGAAAGWPLAARAQQPDRMRRIGVLMGYAESDLEVQAHIAAFREGLQKFGWTEGRNIQIDTRWAAPDDAASMRRFAKELVAPQPDVILSNTTPTTTALLQQTLTIPIVFAIVADPVGSGFVASFARPGGNVTGFTFTEPTMAGKELLKEIAPRVVRIAMLFNPVSATYADYWLNPFRAAAPSFAVEAIAAPVHDTSELESVIAAQAREPNGGLIAMPTVKQQKTGVALAIPVHPELRTVLDATPSEHLTFLVTATGKPYGGNAFSEQFRNWCDAAGLPRRCKPHGLRKAACRRLAEHGCSAKEIMSISGHTTMKEIVRYTVAADQARLARNAMTRTMVTGT